MNRFLLSCCVSSTQQVLQNMAHIGKVTMYIVLQYFHFQISFLKYHEPEVPFCLFGIQWQNTELIFIDLAQCDSSLAYRKVSHCERMYVGGRTSFVGCRKSSFFCSLVNKNSFCSLRLCHLSFQNNSKTKFSYENKVLVVKVSKSRRNYAKVKLFFQKIEFHFKSSIALISWESELTNWNLLRQRLFLMYHLHMSHV